MASEAAAAAKTAQMIGADHSEIILAADSIGGWWKGWLDSSDRPSVDGLNTYVISGALKRAGATVAFSGLGADELFGGYANFRRVRQLGPLLRAAAVLPRNVRQAIAKALMPCVPRRYWRRVDSLAGNSGRPLDLAIEMKRNLSPASLRDLGLDARHIDLTEDFLAADSYAYFDDVGQDPFLAVSRVETYLCMGNTLLRDSDTNSMAHSVELRVPFVSRPLLEEVGRIPVWLHMGRTRSVKHILRKGVAQVVPDHVLKRRKTGFTLPVGDWMFSELRDSCEAAVTALTHVPFLDSAATAKLWQSFVIGRQHNYWMKPMTLVALGSYVANARARASSTSGLDPAAVRPTPKTP